MPDPRLPVIYAVIEDGTNSLVTACESNKDAELNASAQHRMSETREYRVIAYPPPPESPPREYWRLLEPGEMAQPGDECIRLIRYELRWKPIENCMIGKEVAHVRRRVSPPPKCETCSSHTKRDKHNITDDRVLYCERFLIPRRKVDYCSEHPQAQEANRG